MSAADEAPWLMLAAPHGTHVLPLQEINRHELDVGCWCGPWIERVHPVTLRTYDQPIVGHVVIGDGLGGVGVARPGGVRDA